MHAQTPDLDRHPVAERAAVVEQVPVIDVADVFEDSSSAAAADAIDQIAEACRTWGFFQVVNHGVGDAQIREVWKQTHALFALPLEEKMGIVRTRENPWGFYNNELTKNQRDKKEVFDFTCNGIDPIYHQANRWPLRHPQFRATMTAYLDACAGLSLKLLEAFCLGLDLPADFMHRHFVGNHTGFVRLNYYPVKDPMAELAIEHQPTADLGIHHHTDAGALTVLLQDEVSGLQVYRDGYWYDIPTVAGAMVINTGDMMQVWSNDTYRAAIHRVLAMDAHERYSIPFFFNPAAACRVSPLPSVVSEQNPARYDAIEWGSFRGKRSDGDYADYGTEVQISQYRI
ncbi:MAG: hypothetical protein OEO19_18705 [Gammaproteobacteria bacterium]|nr:hypothetical protein [Gammaproteobacteria bacterium]MDH3447730.1 hypothetical protein [Gammaproteobacteria bacterium]